MTVANTYQLDHVSKESDLRRMAANNIVTKAASLRDIVVAELFKSLIADNDSLCRPLQSKSCCVSSISPLGK